MTQTTTPTDTLTTAPRFHRITIDRFRGIQHLEWKPNAGVNIILCFRRAKAEFRSPLYF
jgi:hypothetical protein